MANKQPHLRKPLKQKQTRQQQTILASKTNTNAGSSPKTCYSKHLTAKPTPTQQQHTKQPVLPLLPPSIKTTAPLTKHPQPDPLFHQKTVGELLAETRQQAHDTPEPASDNYN
ncbi:hypothetical protein MtrunA17_Chr7g0267661 [Medicago truncatula]|uniref:Uncharacterized protein n=1 Tax=Medicago truncatula TaxID=3880 RepID=A0A072U4I8_MEDTR|nr:hypothetical protein MTR_7g106590 [Medicago truncatula]RHN48804.1 hypothetical protein MtrunA17_Chr7g0267661 [Medicago truncatula]